MMALKSDPATPENCAERSVSTREDYGGATEIRQTGLWASSLISPLCLWETNLTAMKAFKSLLGTVAGVILLAFLLSGCGLAHQSVSKTGRVLEHGERKLDRHLE
jgi:hypothetical protein